MKTKVSFFAILACAMCMNSTHASDCVGFGCENKPILIDQAIDPMDILRPIRSEIKWADGTTLLSVINDMPADEMDDLCETEYESDDTDDDYDCPFDTDKECEIWRKKPIHKIVVAPRAPHIKPFYINDIIAAIYLDDDITANEPEMEPLVERYKILMRASHACCMEGILQKMHQTGAKDADIYQFLKADANSSVLSLRCMVMQDEEFIPTYSHGITADMVRDVRNTCLCKNREWFAALLQPFFDIYEDAPQFANSPFIYRYTDDLARGIKVHINDEVQTVGRLLDACPK